MFVIKQIKMDYQSNYNALLELPIVKELLRKNKKLRKENKALKNLIYSLPEFRREQPSNEPEIRQTRTVYIPEIKTEVETDPLTDDDEVVIVENEEKQNIIYVIEEETGLPEVAKVVVVESDEDEDETDEVEADAEEVEAEEEEEEVEVEAEAEEETEEVEEEETEETEEVEETEEAEVFEIQISGKTYCTTDQKNGKIYAITEDEEVGDEVGEFKNGEPKFYKK